MLGVGPGTTLGGRYAVRRRRPGAYPVGFAEQWIAQDTTLRRAVVVTVFAQSDPLADAASDAARRAAVLVDVRVTRILDVGTDGDMSYVVEEGLPGSTTVAELLEEGPFPPEEARRIAGEVAVGLETARLRGLHHLLLDPHLVRRTAEGGVKVGGIAVPAALTGIDGGDSAAESRTDATGVVALLYAALTGRWPLPRPIAGLQAAPRLGQSVVPPGEIASGVPTDLDKLCREVLGTSALGPRTPGDVSRLLAPWADARVDPAPRLPEPAEVTPAVVEPTTPAAPPAPPDHADAAEPQETDGSASAGVGGGAALAGVGAAASAAMGKVGALARSAADKATTRTSGDGGGGGEPEPVPATAAAGATVAAAAGATAAASRPASPAPRTAHLPDVLTEDEEERLVEPPLPLLPPETGLAPPPGQSKLVVLIVLSFIVLSLVFAYCGLRGLTGQLGLPTDTTEDGVVIPTTIASPSPSPTATAQPTGTPTTTASPASGPIAILSAKGFDPQGDGKENTADAGKVYDGNLATRWRSEGYKSASLGGLKKGVGVILDLGQERRVSKVVLHLAQRPQDVQVLATNRKSVSGAFVLGKKDDASGRVELITPGNAPATQFVIVWFTRAAPDDGKYRATLAEVALS